jgi:hypothetical protein
MESVQPAAATDVAPAERSSEHEWLTAAEVGELVRVSQRRVHLAVRRGELRAAIVDRRGSIRVHVNWAFHWLALLSVECQFRGHPEG